MRDVMRSEELLQFDAASGIYRLLLPIETRSESNQRGNWRSQHARHAAQRELAAMLARSTLPPGISPRRIRFVRLGGWPLDDGNLSVAFKHIQDGVCAALGLDDGWRGRIVWQYDQEPQAAGTGRRAKTSVRVELQT